jgi:hypothetical protein
MTALETLKKLRKGEWYEVNQEGSMCSLNILQNSER